MFVKENPDRKKKKNINKEFNCAIVVVMIPSNTSQFQYFWDFNKSVSPSNLFLVKFLKFLAIPFG